MLHNGSTYDYHFKRTSRLKRIIRLKELAEEFEGEFKCLGENTYFFSTNQTGNYKRKIRMAIIRLQKYHTK